MGKIRVYKLAKELGIKSSNIIDLLQELGEEISSHMSTIDDEIVDTLKELIDSKKSGTEKKKKTKEKSKKKKCRKKGQTVKKEVVQNAEASDEISSIDGGEDGENVIEVQLPLTVKGLAELLNVNPNTLIGKLIGLGVMATINQNLEPEAIELMAEEFGKRVKFITQEDKMKRIREIEDREEDLKPRPPIVTVMGHVDHGKTSLLDVIRHTNVTATEAGGITQHIGAYQTIVNGKKITFLDTPGHEAFTAMRARGAQITDIAVLVVAADDGVMPQTVEAINHAKAAGIPIIVAINKIDKDNANPDRVLQELSEHGLIPEAWGGDTICVNVSALKKINIDELLEMILLVAEMEELKANPNRPADGVVVEAELDKGRGPVATVLVKRGTLKIGDPIIAGTTYGRVRAMINDKGERVKEAGPSTPVVVLGLSDVPQAGDIFEVVEDDKTARIIAEERAERKRMQELQTKKVVSLDDLFKQIQEGDVKELKLIIKADVQGSVEALRDALLKLSTDEVRVTPIHTGVGGITETDIMLASASDAIVIGFNVRPDLNARKLAERENVEIRTYRVIYKAIEEVKAALEGLLEPEYKEVVVGHAEVRATFKVPKVGTVAGLYVTDGKINRNNQVRLIRNGVVIHEGKIASLKRFKDDVREVTEGYECGLGIEGYNDIKEGDEIEVFEIQEVKRTLD
ncbi:translation initiation factor IF-2 [Anoxybacter fermentans]|uniref:Translation initiation factor IF-2 n=1 Tax=Anoxybacter fermentans TaxID=1323375 RepID=A0A3Q9HP25_9FIRM|nr:translation initiation factor IF-2 [Anoxybacter fermentans]AZR72393.1 translation initiation factor IF-2 [Anoxybacter fermentans]